MRHRILYAIAILIALVNAADGLPAGVTIVTITKSEPVLFGVSDLEKALAGSGARNLRIIVSTGARGEASKVLASAGARLPEKMESFVIARSGNKITIVGSDDVGTMYGLFELAEALQLHGANALDLKTPISRSPYVEFRAVNPFLTLPYGEETMENWWFLSEDFWKGYIEMLARARINWIDLHGMYDIRATNFPNIYPYFIKSDRFPEVGLAPDQADRNLAMLNKVIKMAKSRGIKFAIMSYSASWDGPHLRKSPYQASEENLAEYTRECVRKMIQSCPDLAMIGFRIGESGKREDFYQKSYIPAIKEAGRQIDLYTRTWGANKKAILELGRAFPGRLYIEIKYNGEHYGPPYMIAGGRMAGWRDYSYQDYLTYPRAYRVIWQVRQNGTHRVFPWGNPEFVARTAMNSHLGGAIGFCTEPINSYYPAYDYLHRSDSPCKWYRWVYQRDWFFYDVWGRMSYDPRVPERVWIRKFQQHYGKKAGEYIYRSFIAASQIVPYAYTFYSLGPDHRNHAPELETGGDIKDWATGAPFDLQNVQSPAEYAERVVAAWKERSHSGSTGTPSGTELKGGPPLENVAPTARFSPLQAAEMLAHLSTQTIVFLGRAEAAGNPSKELECLSQDLRMLAHLGNYYAARLKSAASFAVFRLTRSEPFADAAKRSYGHAVESWQALAKIGDSHYKPFVDTLRMKTEHYTWTEEGKKLDAGLKPLEELMKEPATPLDIGLNAMEPIGDRTGPAIDVGKGVMPARDGIKVLNVSARVTDPAGVRSVVLKYKPFPSEALWKTVDMELDKDRGRWTASVKVPPAGIMWAVEAIDEDGNGSMWPDFRRDIPYRVVEPWEKADEIGLSMASAVEKAKANPVAYSIMALGRGAMDFNAASPELKASVLDAVRNGLSLFVDQQDLQKFDLSWLPDGLKSSVTDGADVQRSHNEIRLNASHPLLRGFPSEIKRKEIVGDAFSGGGTEWQFLAEPKAIALRKFGGGYLILSQLKTVDRMSEWASEHYGGIPVESLVSTYIDNVIRFAAPDRPEKPVLVLDQGNGVLPKVLAAMNRRVVICE